MTLSSSWESDRTTAPQRTAEEICLDIKQVDGVLAQLASDSDLRDDLKNPEVLRAMRHWTNEHRLPPEEAEKLKDDYRVVAVLGKINKLQNSCRQLGIAVPLNHFLKSKPELGRDFIASSFGPDVLQCFIKGNGEKNDVDVMENTGNTSDSGNKDNSVRKRKRQTQREIERKEVVEENLDGYTTLAILFNILIEAFSIIAFGLLFAYVIRTLGIL